MARLKMGVISLSQKKSIKMDDSVREYIDMMIREARDSYLEGEVFLLRTLQKDMKVNNKQGLNYSIFISQFWKTGR